MNEGRPTLQNSKLRYTDLQLKLYAKHQKKVTSHEFNITEIKWQRPNKSNQPFSHKLVLTLHLVSENT